MQYLNLINQVGNEDMVKLFLDGQISALELSQIIGSSNTDLVVEYKIQRNKEKK